MFAFLKGSVFPGLRRRAACRCSRWSWCCSAACGAFGGPAVGAVVYKLLDTVITRYTGYWQAVLGGILILLVTVFPRGLVGMLDRRRS